MAIAPLLIVCERLETVAEKEEKRTAAKGVPVLEGDARPWLAGSSVKPRWSGSSGPDASGRGKGAGTGEIS